MKTASIQLTLSPSLMPYGLSFDSAFSTAVSVKAIADTPSAQQNTPKLTRRKTRLLSNVGRKYKKTLAFLLGLYDPYRIIRTGFGGQ
jgi:hypothetical protein